MAAGRLQRQQIPIVFTVEPNSCRRLKSVTHRRSGSQLRKFLKQREGVSSDEAPHAAELCAMHQMHRHVWQVKTQIDDFQTISLCCREEKQRRSGG
ncbi:uncharacterized protein V6R79_015656 [Siganus canaliculatus]